MLYAMLKSDMQAQLVYIAFSAQMKSFYIKQAFQLIFHYNEIQSGLWTLLTILWIFCLVQKKCRGINSQNSKRKKNPVVLTKLRGGIYTIYEHGYMSLKKYLKG